MGLTMGQRKAVTKAIATRYRRASKAGKGAILDELCATTGWHRNHARKALGYALRPRVVRARQPRPPTYSVEVVVALRFCWAVLGVPTGKRLAPVMGELVATLRRFGELDVSDALAAALVAMSPATMDRRLAPDRAAMTLRGRSHTKPGSLLKDAIPIRTWAQWDDAVPGFVEIDLVGHEGGNAVGDHAYTLTVTDIARQITFTRSRPGNSNDGAHVEQKNWAVVRTVVGYHRYDTAAELLLLNRIWVLQSQIMNYFLAQQKLVSKVRDVAKITKRYNVPTTPHRRAERHIAVCAEDKTIMTDALLDLNPAAIQRQIQALTAELLTLTTSKATAANNPRIRPPALSASAHESTTAVTRAS